MLKLHQDITLKATKTSGLQRVRHYLNSTLLYHELHILYTLNPGAVVLRLETLNHETKYF
jgi:hypothetical protein